MNKIKKKKTYYYHKEWEQDYFFVMIENKCCCLICNNSVCIPKKGNVERHFTTVHRDYQIKYPHNSDLRKIKVEELKKNLSSHQLLVSKKISKVVTVMSLRVCHIPIPAKIKDFFNDGLIFKKAFIEAVDTYNSSLNLKISKKKSLCHCK